VRKIFKDRQGLAKYKISSWLPVITSTITGTVPVPVLVYIFRCWMELNSIQFDLSVFLGLNYSHKWRHSSKSITVIFNERLICRENETKGPY